MLFEKILNARRVSKPNPKADFCLTSQTSWNTTRWKATYVYMYIHEQNWKEREKKNTIQK